MPTRLSARASRAALSLLAGLVAAVAVWLATADGPVVTPDGFSYLGAARSLVQHGTLRIPTAEWRDPDSTTALHQFPPAYPVALAGAMHVARPLDAARLVDAGAAFVTVAGLTDLVAGAVGLAGGAAVLLVLLALRGVALAHVTALSEPLFLAVLVVAIACMATVPRRPWTYGIAAAAANLVRYAGASLVGAGAVWAAWHAWHAMHPASHATPRDGRRRLTRTLGAGLVAALPGAVAQLLWTRRVRRAGLEPVGAVPRWTGHVGATLAEGARTLAAHLAPLPLPPIWHAALASTAAAGAGVVVVRGWRVAREPSRARVRRAIAACAVAACAYAAVIVYARLFVGDAIPFDDRILAPLLVCVSIATLVAAAARRTTSHRRARTFVLALALGASWLVAGIVQTIGEARDILVDRDDYTSAEWRTTPVADWLRGDGRQRVLFTNDPVAVYFTVGRPSRTLPETLAADSIAAFGRVLHAADGAIVAYAADVGFGPSADPTTLAHALGPARS